MKSSAHLEIEVKILEIEVADVRKRLSELGAEPVFSGRMHAVFYDRADGAIRSAGNALRLRKEGDRAVLAFKRRRQKERVKIMDEMETEVSDFDAMRMILAGLGYMEIAETEKTREEYQLPDSGATVLIDNYSGALEVVPPFVEIEASSEELLHEVAAQLGYPEDRCLSWDTRDLARHYGAPFA